MEIVQLADTAATNSDILIKKLRKKKCSQLRYLGLLMQIHVC